MLYEALGMSGQNATLTFPDVPGDAWFAPYVQEAFATGVVNGYPDGYFRPENQINLTEALKIISEAFFDVDALYGDGSNFAYCPTEFLEFEGSLETLDKNSWFWKYIHVSGEMCLFDFELQAKIEGGRI